MADQFEIKTIVELDDNPTPGSFDYKLLTGRNGEPAQGTPVSSLPFNRFVGDYDASTNTPALTDNTGRNRDQYKITGAPTAINIDLGSGNISVQNGDYIIHNGSVWEKYITNNVVNEIAFSETLIFDSNKKFQDFNLPSEGVNLSLSESGNVLGNRIFGRIISDGSGSITMSPDFSIVSDYGDTSFENGSVPVAGNYFFRAEYDGIRVLFFFYKEIQIVANQAPTAPTISEVSKTDTTITIGITGATDDVAVTGYDVFIDNVLHETIGNISQHTITGLTADTSYGIKLQAKDGELNSPDSNVLNISTDAVAGFSPGYQSILDRNTALLNTDPGVTQQRADNEFYIDLDNDAILNKLDVLYVTAVDNSGYAKIDWVAKEVNDDVYNLEELPSTQPFTAGTGFDGSASNLIRTPYVPSLNGVQFTSDDACLGIIVTRNDGTPSAPRLLFGGRVANDTNQAMFRREPNDTGSFYRLHGNANLGFLLSSYSKTGFFAWNIQDNGTGVNRQVFIDDIQKADLSDDYLDTGLLDVPLAFLGYNDNGNSLFYAENTNYSIGLILMGRSLNENFHKVVQAWAKRDKILSNDPEIPFPFTYGFTRGHDYVGKSGVEFTPASMYYIQTHKSSDFPMITGLTKPYFFVYSTDHSQGSGGVYWGEADDPKMTNFVELGLIVSGFQAETPWIVQTPNALDGDVISLYYHTSSEPGNSISQETRLITTNAATGLLHNATWNDRGRPIGTQPGWNHTGYAQIYPTGVSNEFRAFHTTHDNSVGGVDAGLSISTDGGRTFTNVINSFLPEIDNAASGTNRFWHWNSILYFERNGNRYSINPVSTYDRANTTFNFLESNVAIWEVDANLKPVQLLQLLDGVVTSNCNGYIEGDTAHLLYVVSEESDGSPGTKVYHSTYDLTNLD